LGHLLLIHIRKAPDVLIEVSQLAGGSGNLNVLGAAFGRIGGRTTANGILGTLNRATCPDG
jgi:hypothetical protein